MRINLNYNTIKNIYKGTDLHAAANLGDLLEVERVLAEHPEHYKHLTHPAPLDRDYKTKACSRATALHFALLGQQYAIAERLLQHPDCPKIINIANSAGASILTLIVMLPDSEEALNLAKLAFDIKGIQVDNVNTNLFYSPLYHACEMGNFEMARLLLERGANPNVIGGLTEKVLLLNLLVRKLGYSNNINEINSLNELILLSIEKGADPMRYGPSGTNFFDEVIGKEKIESKLDPRVKEQLLDRWKISSPEETAKGNAIYYASLPFDSNAEVALSIEDTALLVNLKKARKHPKGSEYECTVLYSREQLESYIKLVRLRFQATKQPFQTQFIMRPRNVSTHVANGQLNFDADGNVNVFWVDTLGHDYAKYDNRVVGDIIHKQLPEATLYTTDTQMQSTETGCHIFALYISERLSAATQNNKDLFGDLKKIHEQSNKEEDGFRIIPWGKCPVYTGLPKIIHSASKPKARIKEGLEEDITTVNKKNQNYSQEMKRFFVKKNGKKVNSFYEINRQKFGKQIIHAYEEEFEILNEKMLAGLTDIVNRVPVDELAEELGIKLIKQGEQWEIVIQKHLPGSYLSDLKGTKKELTVKLNDAYNTIQANLYTTSNPAMEHPDFLFHYAAIHVCKAKIDGLEPEINTVDLEPAIDAGSQIKSQLTFFTSDNSTNTSGIDNKEKVADTASRFI